MRRLYSAAAIILSVACAASAGTVSTNLTNESGLAVNKNYTSNLNNFVGVSSFSGVGNITVSKVAAQVIWSSMTGVSSTFTDGSASTGTVTVASVATLLPTSATDQITVPTTTAILGTSATGQFTIITSTGLGTGAAGKITVSTTTGLTGAVLTITGKAQVAITQGINWQTDATSSQTASNISKAINAQTAVTGIMATYTSSQTVVYTTATAFTTITNNYTIASSTPAALSSTTFSGAVAAAFLTINGSKITNGIEWNADTVYSSNTLLSLENAINQNVHGVMTATTTAGTVLYATATAVGSGPNSYGMASSVLTSISTSATKMSGGANPALVGAIITLNGVPYPYGTYWTDVSGTSTGTALSIATAFNNDALTQVAMTNVTAAGAASTGTLVVSTTTGLSGAILTINGNETVNLSNGTQWTSAPTSSMTAVSITNAINSYTAITGIVASTGAASTIFATATVVGIGGNSYGITSSTPAAISSATFSGGTNNTYGSVVYATATAAGAGGNLFTITTSTASGAAGLSVSSTLFSGGQSAGSLTINGVTFTQGVNFTVTASSTANQAAIAVSNLINSTTTAGKLGLIMVSTTTGNQAVIYATSTAVGLGTLYNWSTNSTGFTLNLATGMSGGTNAGFAINTTTITISTSSAFTTGMQVLYSTGSGVAIGGLTTGTTYYAIPYTVLGNIGLATSSSNSVTGLAVTLTSSRTVTTADSYTLTPLPWSQGAAAAKWQVSNDNINWNDFLTTINNVAISSNTFTPTFPSSSTAVDFGQVGFNYLRYNVVAPTQGGLKLQVNLNGTN